MPADQRSTDDLEEVLARFNDHDLDGIMAGDRGASESTLTGTTTDGVRLEVRGCDRWEFRDGSIVRKDSYWKLVEPA